jgi:hypothetical protein
MDSFQPFTLLLSLAFIAHEKTTEIFQTFSKMILKYLILLFLLFFMVSGEGIFYF